MDNCEQVFDEPMVWQQSAHRDPRVKIRSDSNSLLECPVFTDVSNVRSPHSRRLVRTPPLLSAGMLQA